MNDSWGPCELFLPALGRPKVSTKLLKLCVFFLALVSQSTLARLGVKKRKRLIRAKIGALCQQTVAADPAFNSLHRSAAFIAQLSSDKCLQAVHS